MSRSRTHWSVVLNAQGGDDAAIQTLIRTYRPMVVSYVRGCTNLREEAEDVAQEVFVALIQGGALARVDPARGRFRGYLYTLTRWVLSSYLASKERKKRGGGVTHVRLGELDLPERQASEAFDREWMARLLTVAFGRLAADYPQYHVALERVLLREQTYAQIAAELGKSFSDVRNKVHRGRKKLIAFLREEVQSYSTSRDDYEEELRHLERYMPKADADAG